MNEPTPIAELPEASDLVAALLAYASAELLKWAAQGRSWEGRARRALPLVVPVVAASVRVTLSAFWGGERLDIAALRGAIAGGAAVYVHAVRNATAGGDVAPARASATSADRRG